HPRLTVVRELREELGLEPDPPSEAPLMLTVTETVALTAGHTDVSLWYVVSGNRDEPIAFDTDEFHAARWFHFRDATLSRSDPHLGRFLSKLSRTGPSRKGSS